MAATEISDEAFEVFEQLVEELHLRNLNDMVVGAEPDNAGVAGWALERLRLHVPGLRYVTVGFGEDTPAIVEV